MNSISLLGSTGSIGVQSLDVCRSLNIPVLALAAKSNVKLLAQQAWEFKPDIVAIEDESLYPKLKTELKGLDAEILAGKDAACQAAANTGAQTVINAIVGIAGLRPTLAAISAKKTLALANKESLVTGGAMVMKLAKENNTAIIPVDSEHSAIFQCLQSGHREDVKNIILTASGGPFFGKTAKELENVKAEQALKHPNWSMGRKITIDSATMMNKGLELIEAMWLFDLECDEVEIVVHRQSVLHSAVEFNDGSIIAQLGGADMRTAIQYAITYPRRLYRENARLSLTDVRKLTFEKPDFETFKCLDLCVKAAKIGGLAPCVVNGANERAVEFFLDGKISFLQIGDLVEIALSQVKTGKEVNLSSVEEADFMARKCVTDNYSRV